MKTENEAYTYSGVYHEHYNLKTVSPSKYAPEKVKECRPHEDNPLAFFGSSLIDNTGKQFVCIHEKCQKFCSCFNSELLAENPDFHALHFHPEDRRLWCVEAQPEIQKLIDSIPAEELPCYRFSFNLRYLQKDGNASQFLHEGTLELLEETCHPVLNMKIFTEIGDIKTDNTMVLTLFKYSPEDGYQKVFKKIYGETPDGQLSQREKEIIKLCLQGMSSKMIAGKLNLSIHTVKNHKRNCMEKTLTHNIAELINLCIRSKWL